ncbi:ABC transporter permease [Streptomyces sp. NBC_01283]|uniref:ABC transporter permease n=1 Tax=Streptomyces sp. NBC_01283 TaxID=2903812 RepID=UPI00352E2E14|nr:ABC transporter permease [Streptomyces sp. NBC_01283]
MPSRFSVAAHFALLEHARNRLGLCMIVGFIPLWLTLEQVVIPADAVTFVSRHHQPPLRIPGNDLTLVVAAVNTVTLIIGFMMFTVTYRGRHFDGRLVRSGFPHGRLFAGKMAALIVIAACTAGYTTAVMAMYLDLRSPWTVALGLLGAGLAYGGLGMTLASLLPGELEGMFAIIMVSLVDVGLQNPMFSPAAGRLLVTFLPAYGGMQTAVSGSFTPRIPVTDLLVELAWAGGLATAGLLFFWARAKPRAARRRYEERPS